MSPSQKKEYDEYKRNQPRFAKKFNELANPKRLTTPKSIDESVLGFCSSICPGESPIRIEIQPELWSRFQCCNLNAEELVRLNGGEMVCGYKIWMVPGEYIEGERHAVWHREGIYRDITFNVDGEESIVFIPDIAEKRSEFIAGKDKIRKWIDPKHEPLVRACNYFQALLPVPPKASDEAQWKHMLTYEQFLKGVRPQRSADGRWGDSVAI